MADIKIPPFDGKEFSAYAAFPETGQGPGVVVIADGGLPQDRKKEICDVFAARGYLAVCPEIFGGAGFDKEALVRDLLSALGFVRRMETCTGKVGSVGIGVGGHMAYLLAARSDVDATVVYSPEGLEESLTETYDIITPLLLHVGAKEPLMAGMTGARVMRSVARNDKIVLHVYEEAGPLLAIHGGENESPKATECAADRTFAFLDDRLKV
ncbi:MAG: dienelactone hydrolase family protein [Alphaproteobacteria bacterium]|nr:dienelactone hydrolase family protein [Alphaproteobacteria bacterium]